MPDHIELLKPWGRFPRGHIFTDMGHGQADLLIRRGFARKVLVCLTSGPDNVPIVDRIMRSKRRDYKHRGEV